MWVRRYVPEGSMTTCGGDYLNISWISRSYVILYAVMCYFIPLAIIVYSYYYIVKVSDLRPACRITIVLSWPVHCKTFVVT